MQKLQRTWSAWRGMPAIVRFGVLLVLGILALLALPKDAFADIRYDDAEGDYVQVTGLPCPAKVTVKVGEREDHFLALARLGGRTGSACAALVSSPGRRGPQVLVVFEDGDVWLIDFAAFRAMTGT